MLSVRRSPANTSESVIRLANFGRRHLNTLPPKTFSNYFGAYPIVAVYRVGAGSWHADDDKVRSLL